MVKSSRLFLLKKLLSAATITGCCSGLFCASMTEYLPHESVWTYFLFFMIIVITGISIGSAAKLLNKKDKGLLINKNSNKDMLLAKQRIYLITPVIMVIVFFLFPNLIIKARLAISVLSGGVFILGISGGIFDQFTKGAKKLVSYGMIPLGVSSIYVFISGNQNLKQLIWLMGFLYLMTALITSSTVQLNAKIFGSKDINLKNGKRIRIFNYSMVFVFSMFCVTAAFYRKLAAGISVGLVSASRWLADVFMKVVNWTSGDTSIAYAEPSEAPERVYEGAEAVSEVTMKRFIEPTPVPVKEASGSGSWFSRLIDNLLAWLRGGEIPEKVVSSQELQEILDLAEATEAVENGGLPPVAENAVTLIEEVASPERMNIENMLILVLFVLFIIAVIAIIAFAIHIIKKGLNLSVSESGQQIIEYDEENEIIKTEAGITIRKRFKYTRRGLGQLSGDTEKIRYLYGFILERLHNRKLSIKYSDTPKEIHRKIRQYANGKKLDDIGFNELTEKYRKVRYGNKSVLFEIDTSDLAEKYERVIESIDPRQKKPAH